MRKLTPEQWVAQTGHATFEGVAMAMNPFDARDALARILVALGSSEEWNSDTLDTIQDIVNPIHASSGLPSYGDQSDAVLAFWESIK